MFKVSEAADKLNVSKVTVYNKIKSLKSELKPHIHKIKGVTYIDDTGFDTIKKNLELSNDLNQVKYDINNEFTEVITNNEFINSLNTLNDKVNTLNNDYIDSLKEQIYHLHKELDIKNSQLESKDNLIENFQVLIREDKDKILMLEEKLKQGQTNKGFFNRLFKKQ